MAKAMEDPVEESKGPKVDGKKLKKEEAPTATEPPKEVTTPQPAATLKDEIQAQLGNSKKQGSTNSQQDARKLSAIIELGTS